MGQTLPDFHRFVSWCGKRTKRPVRFSFFFAYRDRDAIPRTPSARKHEARQTPRDRVSNFRSFANKLGSPRVGSRPADVFLPKFRKLLRELLSIKGEGLGSRFPVSHERSSHYRAVPGDPRGGSLIRPTRTCATSCSCPLFSSFFFFFCFFVFPFR